MFSQLFNNNNINNHSKVNIQKKIHQEKKVFFTGNSLKEKWGSLMQKICNNIIEKYIINKKRKYLYIYYFSNWAKSIKTNLNSFILILDWSNNIIRSMQKAAGSKLIWASFTYGSLKWKVNDNLANSWIFYN